MNMRIRTRLAAWLLVAVCACCSSDDARAQVKIQAIQDVIAAVNIDSVTATIRDLTGETPVVVGGKTVTISSRAEKSEGARYAAQYLVQRLKGYGFTPVQQPVPLSVNGSNVFCEQQGTNPMKPLNIICAHFDDRPYPPATIAPGADDNASGVAAVIEAARVLSRYAMNASIVYGLWDSEEIGALGSRVYADGMKKGNEAIAGVVNVDMIGWDSNNDGACDIHLVDTAQSRQLADTMVFLNRTYAIGLNPVIHDPGELGSDHREFLWRGYSAVLLMEDLKRDFNPRYHQSSDSLKYLNRSYLHKNVALGIATIAAMAGVQSQIAAVQPSNSPAAGFSLDQNFPNPFNPSTTFSFSIAAAADVSLRVFDVLGREVSRVVGERMDAGTHRREWAAGGLPSGVYYYRLQDGAFSATRRLILLR